MRRKEEHDVENDEQENFIHNPERNAKAQKKRKSHQPFRLWLAALSAAVVFALFEACLTTNYLVESNGECGFVCTNALLYDSVKRFTGHGCTKHSQRCYYYEKVGRDIPGCCRRKLFELLAFAKDALQRNNVTWWVADGTLLGAIRHGDLIPWDNDMDISVLVDNADDERRLRQAMVVEAKDIGGFAVNTGRLTTSVQYSDLNLNHLDFFRSRRHTGWTQNHFIYRENQVELSKEEVQRFQARHKRDRFVTSRDDAHANIPHRAIFPLKVCKLGHLEVPCPNDAAGVAAAMLHTSPSSLLRPLMRDCWEGCKHRRPLETEEENIRHSVMQLEKEGYPSLYRYLGHPNGFGEWNSSHFGEWNSSQGLEYLFWHGQKGPGLLHD